MFPLAIRDDAHSVRSVAVIRALQLGDMLCAVPALRSLRHALPNARITLIGLPWARTFRDRFAAYIDDFEEFPGYPGIPERDWDERRFQTFKSRSSGRAYDLAVQMHGSGEHINSFLSELGAAQVAGYCPSTDRCPDSQNFLVYPSNCPEIHRHLRLMNFLGATMTDDALDFPINKEDENEFERVSSALSTAGYVCLHVGSRWPSRRWKTSGYALIADALSRWGLQVVLTGSEWEADLANDVMRQSQANCLNLIGKTTLGGMACLIKHSKLLISNDTGAAHIGAAVKTPSVVIVLGSDSARWRPLNHKLHRVVHFPVSCAPCEHFRCPTNHECSQLLDVKTVLTAVEQQLEISESSRREQVAFTEYRAASSGPKSSQNRQSMNSAVHGGVICVD